MGVVPLGTGQVAHDDPDAPPGTGRRVDDGSREHRAHVLAVVRSDVDAGVRAAGARVAEVVERDVRPDDRTLEPGAVADDVPSARVAEERLQLLELRELAGELALSAVEAG